jgi:hypothetical protein
MANLDAVGGVHPITPMGGRGGRRQRYSRARAIADIQRRAWRTEIHFCMLAGARNTSNSS